VYFGTRQLLLDCSLPRACAPPKGRAGLVWGVARLAAAGQARDTLTAACMAARASQGTGRATDRWARALQDVHLWRPSLRLVGRVQSSRQGPLLAAAPTLCEAVRSGVV